MKPKDRVTSALNHRPPVDRVPIFLWFHPDTADRLGKMLEIPSGWVGEAIGNDVRQTWVNNNYAMEGIVHEKDGESHVDAWGIRWVRGYSFNQIAHYPLEHSSPEEVEAYVFPQDQIDQLFEAMDRTAAAQGDCWLGCDVSPCGYEMFWRLRGMETALLDMVERPTLAVEMIERCASFAIRLAEEAYRRYATGLVVDWRRCRISNEPDVQPENLAGNGETCSPARLCGWKGSPLVGGLPLLWGAAPDHPGSDRNGDGCAQSGSSELPWYGYL